jgi:tetratricopeptide (TPR) repeat protein
VLADRNGDRGQQLHQIWGAWAATSSAGNYTEGAVLAEQFYRLALADGGPDHVAHAHMMKMTSSYRLGDLSLAEDHFERGEPFFAAPEFRQRPGQTAQVYGNAARIAWIRTNDAAAQNRIDHALSLAKESNNPYDLAYSFYMAAVHLALTESFASSAAFAREAIELSEKYGFPQFATISRVTLGRAQAGLGSAAEGAEMIRVGLAGMEATSARVAMTMYMTWLAEAHVIAGAFTQALTQVEDALQVNPQEKFFRPETLRVRGGILAQLGRRDEGERAFFDAIALADRIGGRRFGERAARCLHQLLRNPGAI